MRAGLTNYIILLYYICKDRLSGISTKSYKYVSLYNKSTPRVCGGGFSFTLFYEGSKKFAWNLLFLACFYPFSINFMHICVYFNHKMIVYLRLNMPSGGKVTQNLYKNISKWREHAKNRVKIRVDNIYEGRKYSSNNIKVCVCIVYIFFMCFLCFVLVLLWCLLLHIRMFLVFVRVVCFCLLGV